MVTNAGPIAAGIGALRLTPVLRTCKKPSRRIRNTRRRVPMMANGQTPLDTSEYDHLASRLPKAARATRITSRERLVSGMEIEKAVRQERFRNICRER